MRTARTPSARKRDAFERPFWRRWRVGGLFAAALTTTFASPAAADPTQPAARGGAPAGEIAAEGKRVPAVILPTNVRDLTPRRIARPPPADVVALAVTVDGLLTDTAQDLGLAVDLTRRPPRAAPHATEQDLLAEAKAVGGYVLAPTLELRGADLDLRILLAQAGSPTIELRVEHVTRDDASVRAVIMLRDLVHAASGSPSRRGATEPEMAAEGAPAGTLATPARSAGRAVLVVNATVYGGLAGYSIQRASGSSDPRMLYPLLAVGAGVGLGGSLIVAEEWDVGVGDAWFLAAGAWWPTVGAQLIYDGRFAPYATSTDERWTFGLIGGAAGLTIASLALTYRGMGDGGAVVANSGGALGLVFGGLADVAIRGDVSQWPFAGMGYGAVLGWLAGSALATPVRFRPSRVITVDLGAALGGLGGAALASPLLLTKPTETKQQTFQRRAWCGATAAAAVLGGGIAWFATRDRPAAPAAWLPPGTPMVGVLGESAIGEKRAPIYGLGWQGSLQ